VSAPAPAAPNRALVAAAVVFVLVVVALGAATLIDQGFRSTSERSSALAVPAGQLTVRNAHGDVRLAPSPDGLVHVHTLAEHGLEAPELIEESTPTGLELGSRCTDSLAVECAVEYTIEVPPSFAVRVAAEAGDVEVRGLTGPLTVDSGSGDLHLLDLSGHLDVRTVAGEVEARRLRSGTVQLDTGFGDVRLELLTAPDSVRVRSEYGEVDITVPEAVPYRVQVDAGSGEQRISVPTDPTSARSITASSGAGDVSVQALFGDAPDAPLPPAPPEPPRPPVPPVPPPLPDGG
jgi:hypothetical protein